LNEDAILFIDKKHKNTVIDELIQKAVTLGKANEKALFKKAIEEREMLVSTGIGLGVAIPHARVTGIEQFFMVAGILKEPVEWESIDNKPVRLIFLIGGPPHEHKTYLKLLAQIILIVKNDIKREAIFKAQNARDVLKNFL
jgi:PTS system nitrogen regulatory IIA component